MPDRDVESRGSRFQGRPMVSAAGADMPPLAASILLVACVLLVACTHENVTPVIVASVTVSPPAVSAFDGEEVQLAATVRDDQGVAVGSARVTWSSDDRSVVTVDEHGTARAVAVGTTTVRATVQDASGSATVVVLRAPTLDLSQDSVALYAAEGASESQPVILAVTNGGGGSLEQLGIEVSYPAGAPGDWLDVTAPGGGLPAELTLAARPGGLSIGTYQASLTLTAEPATNSPLIVPVTLALTGLRITEDGGGTNVTEAGGTDAFTVALAVQPTTTVQVQVISDDPGEVRVSPDRLTFQPSVWNQPQTVSVTGWDDPLIDGDQVTDVRLSLNGQTAGLVRVTTTDDDEAGLAVAEGGGSTTVAESGTSDVLSVTLEAQPASTVVLRVTSGDPGEVTVDPERLTFAPPDWNAAQVITLTGVDDDLIDGNQTALVTISVDAAESDAAFASLADRTVLVTTLDQDVPGLTIAESGAGTYVTEAGSRDRLTVALSAGPPADVVMTIASDDPGEVTVEPSALRFTPGNWRDPQPVIVTGVDDGVDDGDVSTLVRLSTNAGASHDSYDGMTPRTVRVITTDNDGYGVTVTESDGATIVSEGGGQDVFTIVLDQAPWFGDVVIDITSGDAGEVTLTPAVLRFTPSDWSTPRTVVLTGVDDPLADGDQQTVVTIAVNDAASDLFYRFVPDRTLTVITTDDDGAVGASIPPGP